MKKPKRILLSFVGSNDVGKLKDKNDGPIMTALANQKFDEVILLWNKSGDKEFDYQAISNYLKDEIKKRKLANKTDIIELQIKNVTDHNQIYLTLKDFTDKLVKSEKLDYTAAISSGTPAMQVCWILLSESGDFCETNKLNLIQVKNPKFGTSGNIPVKIDTALPKIIRLKEEVDNIKKDLIPTAIIDIAKGQVKIGNILIDLAPMEFCYYRYFAERIVDDLGSEKFSGFWTSKKFLESVYQYHEESYPDLESMRDPIKKMLKNGVDLLLTTFRGNVTKANKKIRAELNNETLSNEFEISNEGNRGAKFYGIKAPKNKIRII
jgi:hypothetical protein